MYFNAVWNDVLVVSAPGARAPMVFIMGLLFVYNAIRRPEMVSKQWSVPAPVLTDCSACIVYSYEESNENISMLNENSQSLTMNINTIYTHTW